MGVIDIPYEYECGLPTVSSLVLGVPAQEWTDSIEETIGHLVDFVKDE